MITSAKKNQEFSITIDDFFCGLHFLIVLADQTEITIKSWDKLRYADRPIGFLASSGYSKGESGTLNLTRATFK